MAGSEAISSVGRDLADLVECPICAEIMYPPIYQCPNGHTICSNCKPSVNNRCPECRGEIGDIRALVLEKMASSLRLPCTYHESGCNGLLPYDDKQNHENVCKFRPYKCPYPCSPCTVTEDVPVLLNHLLVDHAVIFHETTLIHTIFRHADPYSCDKGSCNIDIYSCLGEHFCLHCEMFPSPMDMVYMVFLTYIGDDIDALGFRYSVEIGDGDLKMSWQGLPRSIREGVSTIKDGFNGLVIHRGVAQFFSDVNSFEMLQLSVKGRIWRVAAWE